MSDINPVLRVVDFRNLLQRNKGLYLFDLYKAMVETTCAMLYKAQVMIDKVMSLLMLSC